ncbi:hypothetical protein ACN2CC_03310 [Mesorhizobium muleiense]|uniref:hypothetical protein n=1 Tax=Mesorhizobium muleiense TaxID=1004279 RepID=UPI003AFB6421
MAYVAVLATEMLDAQLHPRPDPLRRQSLIHGFRRRSGVFLDALPQSLPHAVAQGDEGGIDIFPGAWFGQQGECSLAPLALDAEQLRIRRP